MSTRTADVTHAAKSLAKEVLWSTLRHRQGSDPNILMFATRRGGSTFVMELIAANKGIRSIDQPFSVFSPNMTPAQYRRMPKFPHGQLVDLDDRRERELKGYTEGILAGQLPVNAPLRFWRRDFDFVSDRIVVKVLGANSLIEWFSGSFPVKVVYLSRHPIPQALSCLRNKWNLTVDAYLTSERFVSAHLSPEALEMARQVLRDGSRLQQFVLNWGLENMVPLAALPDHPEWVHVTYEDTVLHPESTLDRLAERLGLHDRAAMDKVLTRASASRKNSTEGTNAAIASGQRDQLVEGWKRHVDDDEERRCFEILETLGITTYRAGSFVAVP